MTVSGSPPAKPSTRPTFAFALATIAVLIAILALNTLVLGRLTRSDATLGRDVAIAALAFAGCGVMCLLRLEATPPGARTMRGRLAACVGAIFGILAIGLILSGGFMLVISPLAFLGFTPDGSTRLYILLLTAGGNLVAGILSAITQRHNMKLEVDLDAT